MALAQAAWLTSVKSMVLREWSLSSYQAIFVAFNNIFYLCGIDKDDFLSVDMLSYLPRFCDSIIMIILLFLWLHLSIEIWMNHLFAEQKKQKISELKVGLDEAEALV